VHYKKNHLFDKFNILSINFVALGIVARVNGFGLLNYLFKRCLKRVHFLAFHRQKMPEKGKNSQKKVIFPCFCIQKHLLVDTFIRNMERLCKKKLF
jgi:hypothetical protein